MTISALITHLAAFQELYGDLGVYQVSGQVYTPMTSFPWLAAPTGAIPVPAGYIVCFGQTTQPAPIILAPQE